MHVIAKARSAKLNTKGDVERNQKHVKRVVARVTKRQLAAGKKMKKDEKKLKKVDLLIKKERARDKSNMKKAKRLAAKATQKRKMAKIESMSALNVRKTALEQKLRAKVEAEVNGPYKKSLMRAAEKDVQLKANLRHEMAKATTKAAIKSRLHKRLKVDLMKKVYTIREARLLRALDAAKVKNEVRNEIWAKLDNKRGKKITAASLKDKHTGVFLKPGSLKKTKTKGDNPGDYLQHMRAKDEARKNDKKATKTSIYIQTPLPKSTSKAKAAAKKVAKKVSALQKKITKSKKKRKKAKKASKVLKKLHKATKSTKKVAKKLRKAVAMKRAVLKAKTLQGVIKPKKKACATCTVSPKPHLVPLKPKELREGEVAIN